MSNYDADTVVVVGTHSAMADETDLIHFLIEDTEFVLRRLYWKGDEKYSVAVNVGLHEKTTAGILASLENLKLSISILLFLGYEMHSSDGDVLIFDRYPKT